MNLVTNSVIKGVEKSASHILSLIIALLLSILLFACSPENKSNLNPDIASPRIAQCIVEQSKCEFELSNAKAQVLFDVEKIIAEQPFNMIVKYQGSDKLKSITGYLEGVDMYMGKIPLFFDAQAFTNDSNETTLKSSKTTADKSKEVIKQFKHVSKENTVQETPKKVTPLNLNEFSQVFQTEVLVGSCSSAQMKWRIWLTFTTEKNIKHTKMFTVPSYRTYTN